MEDKAARSRRSGLDRCSDSIKKHSSEICYENSYSRSRSSDSPSCHKKSHYGVQVEKDYRNDNYQQTNDRFRDQKHKDHKAEVHRLAELVCGDWSEHVSSSGKRYYYNCKTEVSQWEKPKEWNEVSVLPPGNHSDLSQQAFHSETIADRSVKDDGGSVQSSVHVDDRLNSKSSFASQQLKSSSYSRVQSSSSSSNAVPMDVAKSTVDASLGPESRQQRDTDSKRFTNSVKASSFADSSSLENSHWSAGSSQCSLPVSVSGVYGLVSSSRESSSTKRHNGSKNVETSQADTRLTTDEDMDISPGSTPTEESLLEKRLNAFNNTSSPNASHLNAETGDESNLCGPASARNSSPSNGTFLSTLTSLQQALHHVTPSGNTGLAKSVPSSTLNLLASLPSLVNQLQEAERTPLTAVMSSQSQHSNQQQILQQVIQMLQKLQQALVAQQQQQQQRQLQELLRQLLNMQKQDSINSTCAATSAPISNQHTAHLNNSAEDSLENAKLESPYSPPDSDGTPLGSPENHQGSNAREGARQVVVVDVVTQSNESPRSSEQRTSSSSSVKPPSNSPDRTVAVTTAVSNSVLIMIPSSVQSAILVGTSHLGTGVLRKQQDSIGLTPTLANYVNNRLTDHIVGWQTESIERQANCYSEESNSSANLQCPQTSVDLKQARSLVRLNEIQTTLQEQRVMFIRQQMKDLENMRTGHVFQANVHNTDT